MLYASTAIVERLRAEWPPQPANPLLYIGPCAPAAALGLVGTDHHALELPTAPSPRLPGDLYTVTGNPSYPLWLPGNRRLQGGRATRLRRAWHNPDGYYEGQFGPLPPAARLQKLQAHAFYSSYLDELPGLVPAAPPYCAPAVRLLTFEDYVRQTQGDWQPAMPVGMLHNYRNDAAPRWNEEGGEAGERARGEERRLTDIPLPYLGQTAHMIVGTETAELTPNAFAGLRRLLEGGDVFNRLWHGNAEPLGGDPDTRPAYGHTWDTMTDDAEDRGWQLLEDYLEPHQYASLRETGRIVVAGSRGTSYRLRDMPTFNVTELDDDGRPITQLCVVPTEAVPRGDRLLAQLLLLQADEPGYWRRANVRPHDAYAGPDTYYILRLPPWERPAARERHERYTARMRARQAVAQHAAMQTAAAQERFTAAMQRAAAATQVEIEELGRAMVAIMATYQPTMGQRVAANMARTEQAARAHGAGLGDALLLTLQHPEVADAYGLPIPGAPIASLLILTREFHMTQRDALRYLFLVRAREGEPPERHAYRAFSRYQLDLFTEDHVPTQGRLVPTLVVPATPRQQTAQPQRPRGP